MSHREAAGAPPRRWGWRRRPRQVPIPDHLWPLIERTARLQRMSPEEWVVRSAGQAASAALLGRLPPRPGPAEHPQRWRQALAVLARAEDAHLVAVRSGHVDDVDGRFEPAAAPPGRRPGRPRLSVDRSAGLSRS